MIRFYIVIAWILGVFVALFSLVALIVMPLGTSLSVIGVFALLMAGLISSIKKEKAKIASSPQPVTDSVPLVLQVFSPGNGIQLLETIYLLETTCNLKTLDSRIGFLHNIYSRFVISCQFDNYKSHIAKDIERYCELYSGRMISSVQQQLINQPDPDTMLSFVSRAIYECYARYVQLQLDQIRDLVRPSAKEKRLEKLKMQRDEFIALYAKYDIPEQGNPDRIRRVPIVAES